MPKIDDGLRHLEEILTKGTLRFKAEARMCARMRETADERKAKGWLISMLKRMEDRPEKYEWRPVQSGIILYEAGLIGIDQRHQGVTVVLESIGAPG